MTTVEGPSSPSTTSPEGGVEGDEEYDDVELEDDGAEEVDDAEESDDVEEEDDAEEDDEVAPTGLHGTLGSDAPVEEDPDAEESSSYYKGFGNEDIGILFDEGDLPSSPEEGKIIIADENDNFIEVDEDEPISRELFEVIIRDLFGGTDDEPGAWDEDEITQALARFDSTVEDFATDGEGEEMTFAEAFEGVLGLNIERVIDNDAEPEPYEFPGQTAEDIGVEVGQGNTQYVNDTIFSALPPDMLDEIQDIKDDLTEDNLSAEDTHQIVLDGYATIRAECESYGEPNNQVALVALTSAVCEAAVEAMPPRAADMLMGIRHGVCEGNVNSPTTAEANIMMSAFVLNGPGLSEFHLRAGHDHHNTMADRLAAQNWNELTADNDWGHSEAWTLTHDHRNPFAMMLAGAAGKNMADESKNRDAMADIAEQYGEKWRTQDGDKFSNE